MGDRYLVEPDLDFVKDVIGRGGDSLKKCFQCATCAVVCPISPDKKPFPRKEMIAASWGLKEKLVHNVDIWLCHECGDCSTSCPRDAKPGDVLSAVRSLAISDYATPKFIANAVNDPQKLPLLLGVPAIIFAVLAFLTMYCGGMMETIFDSIFGFTGFHWSHGTQSDVTSHSDFVSTWFVDMVFVPLAFLAVLVFAQGLVRFVNDIHANAVAEGKTDKEEFEIAGFFQALVRVIPVILKHDKFSECSENKDRATAHLMVLFGFIGLFIVTSIFFVVMYGFGIHGPYQQLNPVKWLANIAGISLVIGGALMIKNRLTKENQTSSYKDWYLLGLVFGLGATGMLTEMTRLAGSAFLAYFFYYLHLILIFNLFAFLPFSKMAHFVYRTVAMAYAEYANR